MQHNQWGCGLLIQTHTNTKVGLSKMLLLTIVIVINSYNVPFFLALGYLVPVYFFSCAWTLLNPVKKVRKVLRSSATKHMSDLLVSYTKRPSECGGGDVMTNKHPH